jgi:hypothetical protein
MDSYLIAVIALLILLLPIVSCFKEDFVDSSGVFTAKAPYIQSPANTTYSYNSLTLNVTFYADLYEDYGYSMNYSLDRKANQTIQLNYFLFGIDQQSKSYIAATVPILNLSEGTHNLTVYLQDEVTTAKTYYDSQTVVFTITANPSNPPNSPTPSVPELSWLLIMPLLIGTLTGALLLRHRKPAQTR